LTYVDSQSIHHRQRPILSSVERHALAPHLALADLQMRRHARRNPARSQMLILSPIDRSFASTIASAAAIGVEGPYLRRQLGLIAVVKTIARRQRSIKSAPPHRGRSMRRLIQNRDRRSPALAAPSFREDRVTGHSQARNEGNCGHRSQEPYLLLLSRQNKKDQGPNDDGKQNHE